MLERQGLSGINLSFERGSHSCHFFETLGEQKEVILPFFREGLQSGEACVYITCDQTVDDWCFEFQAYGIDVRDTLESGALEIFKGADFRETGDFNTVVKAREVWTLIRNKLRRFKAVRIAGDASWTLDPPMPIADVCHWEATAGLVYEDVDVRVICQYNLQKQPPAAVHTALRTHKLAILDGVACSSPYYEAARILKHEPHLFDSQADGQAVQEMLRRLRTRTEPA
jgi:hypothetical protein